MDILETQPIEGATLIQQDFTEADAADRLKALLNGKADIVMSDMAANTTGHQQTDHLRTIGLVEAAYEYAKKNFKKVGHCKPDASRQGSPETYLVCQGFRGSLREEA